MTHREKDTKGPKNPRGDAVVVKILGATREELAKVGYRALRVEDVAVRADVHKRPSTDDGPRRRTSSTTRCPRSWTSTTWSPTPALCAAI